MYVLYTFMFSESIAYRDVDIMLPLIQINIDLVLLVMIIKCWLPLNIQLKHHLLQC